LTNTNHGTLYQQVFTSFPLLLLITLPTCLTIKLFRSETPSMQHFIFWRR